MANKVTKTVEITSVYVNYVDTEKEEFVKDVELFLTGVSDNGEALEKARAHFAYNPAIIPYKVEIGEVNSVKYEMDMELFMEKSITEGAKQRGKDYVMRTISKSKAMCKVVSKVSGDMSERYVYCDASTDDLEKRRKAFDKANAVKHPDEIVVIVGELVTVEEKRYMELGKFMTLASLVSEQ